MKRCQSILGAQFFRVKFGLDKLNFHIDDDILDAMSYDEEHKVVTRDAFLIAYKNYINHGGS